MDKLAKGESVNCVKGEGLTYIFYKAPVMLQRREVDPNTLVPGEKYHSVPIRANSGLDEIRGTFVEYYTNVSGYKMSRFRPTMRRSDTGEMVEYPPSNPAGFICRIFTGNITQMRRFYSVARFTESEVRELRHRVQSRLRREAQRGFIGSFPEGRVMGTWPVEKLPAVIIGLIAQFI